MRFNVIKKTAVTILLLFFMFVYFSNATTIMIAVKEGLLLCYDMVIPSLFVFIVICNILSCADFCDYLAIPFMPYFKLLGINNRKISSYCILGILGGFASGAVMIDKIRNEYSYDENTIGLLTVIMSGNSPSFVILAVGAYYLGNIYSGIIIYLSLLSSSFITTFILSFIYKPSNINICKNILASTNNPIVLIKSSITTILNICGVVTLTYTVCKVVSLRTSNTFIFLVFSSFLEVTTACEFAVQHYGKNVYLLSLILSLYPLSTYLQIKSIGNNNTLNLKILFISKTIQIPLMLLILRTLLNLFPQYINVYLSQDINVYMHWNNPKISLYFLLLSICFILFTDKKLKVFTIRSK